MSMPQIQWRGSFTSIFLAALFTLPSWASEPTPSRKSTEANVPVQLVLEEMPDTEGPFEILLAEGPLVEGERYEETRKIRLSLAEISPEPVELPDGSSWNLRILDSRYWVQPRSFTVAADRSRVNVSLESAAQVIGRVQAPRNTDPPEHLHLRAHSTGEPLGPIRAETYCPVSESRFLCKVPAGSLDLRLASVGFVPQYVWDVSLRPQMEHDLGSLELKRGASLVGWVETSVHEIELARAEVQLQPNVSGFDDREATRRHGHLARTVSADANGFFQLSGISPGNYRLRVKHPRLSSAQLENVEIRAGTEQTVPPIQLYPLSSLAIQVEPSKDPFHGEWKIELHRQTVDPSYWGLEREGHTSTQGELTLNGLDEGLYSLSLTDSRGSRWVEDKLELLGGEERFHLFSVPLRRLEIKTSYEEEPLAAASVTLSDSKMKSRFSRTSNDKGSSYFFLPKGRAWLIEVEHDALGLRSVYEDVDVPRKRPGDPWSILELEIPETSVIGQVIDSRGMPLSSAAFVDIESVEDGLFSRRTRGDGSFEIRGLRGDKVRLQARFDRRGQSLTSNTVEVLTQEDSEVGPVRLELRETVTISGIVVAPDNQGIPGVFVVSHVQVMPGSPGKDIFLPQTFTDADGSFEIEVPAKASAAVLSVYPKGFAATQQLVELPSPGPVVIPVWEEGGRLSLSWDRSDEAREDPALDRRLKTHTTVIKDLTVGKGVTLVLWSQRNEVLQEPGYLELPMMEPGFYTVCFGDLPGNQLAQIALASGTFADRCASGELSAFGELDLEIPTEGSIVDSRPGAR